MGSKICQEDDGAAVCRAAGRRRVHLTAELRVRALCQQTDLSFRVEDLPGRESDLQVNGFGRAAQAAGLGKVEALEVPPPAPPTTEAVPRQISHFSPRILREEQGARVKCSLVVSDGSVERGGFLRADVQLPLWGIAFLEAQRLAGSVVQPIRSPRRFPSALHLHLTDSLHAEDLLAHGRCEAVYLHMAAVEQGDDDVYVVLGDLDFVHQAHVDDTQRGAEHGVLQLLQLLPHGFFRNHAPTILTGLSRLRPRDHQCETDGGPPRPVRPPVPGLPARRKSRPSVSGDRR